MRENAVGIAIGVGEGVAVGVAVALGAGEAVAVGETVGVGVCAFAAAINATDVSEIAARVSRRCESEKRVNEIIGAMDPREAGELM